MRIEDVIRIAFNKVAKRYRGTYLAQFDLNQPYHRVMITDEVMGSMVGRTLVLAMKRRSSRKVIIDKGYLKRMKNICAKHKLKSWRSEGCLLVLFKNFIIYFYLQDSVLSVCVDTSNINNGHIIQNILPSDLIHLLIGLEEKISYNSYNSYNSYLG